jgi:ribosomal protein S18 acetylase RimI-like enzyme
MLNDKTSPKKPMLITEAKPEHYDQIASFLNENNQIHRHLDWLGTLDWLGYQPYLLMIKDKKINAVLCATPENDKSAWVRTFAAKKNLPLEETWQKLLEKAISKLEENGINQLAALALHSWFEGLLSISGFKHRQNIVVLEWGGKLPSEVPINPDIEIRPMNLADLPEVHTLDKIAFQPLWQNSLAGLTKAYEQPGISTVAVCQGTIIGYQISTTMTIYGHLSRLAVNPEYQRSGIASALVYDLLRQFVQQGFWQVTVNTQSDNSASLKLYDTFGFEKTGEEIPVYKLDL